MGAYGRVAVVKGVNPWQDEETLAIKKLEINFKKRVDLPRSLRELKIMRLLKSLDNLHLLTIDTIFSPQPDNSEELYVVTELTNRDLSQAIETLDTKDKDFYSSCKNYIY